jgi:uncharacterized protein involved in exopolysaccharide biosynthesis
MMMRFLPPGYRRYVELAWSKRKAIGLFVASVTAASIVVALLLPRWYMAESTVLPPAEGSDAFGMMAGLIQTSALNKLGMVSTSTPSDVFAEILKSRGLHEELIRKFDLIERYRARNLDVALEELREHVDVGVNSSGLIIVHVEDHDPHRAAEMTNHLVSMLDRFNRETYSTKAKRTRQFLESRLADISARLREAESTLTAYEREHKVVASSEAAAVEGIANVVARKLNLQVRRSYELSYSRPGSAALQEIDAEMAAVDRELAKLPVLKQAGARLALEADIQRKVFTLMNAQYEEARVQETRDTPTLTVLDVARPPEIPSRPRRTLIVLASFGIAVVSAAAWVGFLFRNPPPA